MKEDGAAATGRAGEEHLFFFFFLDRKDATSLVALARAVVGKPFFFVSPLPFTSRILFCPSLDYLLLPSNGFFGKERRVARGVFPRRICMASLAFRRSEA